MARFTVETRKSVPGYAWRNTYHVESAGIIAAVSASLALATFERTFLWNGATMDETKVAPWPDPSGTGFIISAVGLPGGRALINPAPAPTCLFAEILSATGRPGKKWYRFSLDESEVNPVAGSAVLPSDAPVRAVFDDAETDLLATMDVLDADLLIGGGFLTARLWAENLRIDGVGFRDTDIGWYNRTPPP